VIRPLAAVLSDVFVDGIRCHTTSMYISVVVYSMLLSSLLRIIVFRCACLMGNGLKALAAAHDVHDKLPTIANICP
jgi:hypothetical protein